MQSNYKKKCYLFIDKVCDDLSEVILQYLSLEDKLRLECVSKQFQRTIFQKHYSLEVKEKCDLRALKSVAKKCPNIKTIQFLDKIIYRNLNYNKMIEIIDCCLSLVKDCNFGLNYIINESLKRFPEELNSIKMSFNCNFVKSLLKSFINIEVLDLYYYELSPQEITEFEFKKLTKLWIYFYGEEVNGFSHFVEMNKSITHLNIGLFISDRNVIKFILNQISKLKHLIHFDIWSEFGLNDKCFAEELKQISLNCSKIKSICCHLRINSRDYSEFNQLLSSFKYFKRLKRLNLYFSFDDSLKSSEDFQLFSSEVFKGFEDLTHLTLKFIQIDSNDERLNERLLKDIDIRLPKLQYLLIPNELRATEELSNIVRQLSKLETIKLKISDQSIREFNQNYLLENCRKIKSIDFNYH